MSKRSPTNTTKDASDNPMLVLLDAMMMGSHGSIERQEQRGQQELVESDTIPAGFGRFDKDTAEYERQLTALGFVLGEVVPGDPIFRYATLPPGWKKVGTDHAMWSKIVDETGKERCSIFYKAAFYDRSAFISICEDRSHDHSRTEAVCEGDRGVEGRDRPSARTVAAREYDADEHSPAQGAAGGGRGSKEGRQ